MTDSALPLAWFDDLLRGLAGDVNPDIEEKTSTRVTTTDSILIHDFSRSITQDFSNQLDELALSISEPDQAPLMKRTILTSRRIAQSKSRRVSGIRTDTARRMEIEHLKLEVPTLEAHIDFLMQKAVSRAGHLPSLDKARIVNERLREIAHLQQLWIARGISAISQSLPQYSRPLLNYSIRLSCDMYSRVKTRCDLKANILRDGREILHERMRYLNPDFLPQYDVSSHSTPEGDACASVFAMIPVEGAGSVKEVVNILRGVLTLDRVFTCQKTGTCSISDAVDADSYLTESGIAYRRCVHVTINGRVIEFKGALFFEYQGIGNESKCTTSSRDSSEQATIVIHSVDDHQLHPFVSGRVRLGMTSIISIHHNRNISQRNLQEITSGKDGIVVARMSFVKLCRGDVPIPASELRAEMDYTMSKWREAVEASLELLSLK